MASVAIEQDITLPPLRQELQIRPGPPQVNGAPSWTVFDPIRHSFFQVGHTEFRVLTLWAAGAQDDIEPALQSDGLTPNEAKEALKDVLEFSLANSLTLTPAGPTVESYAKQKAATKRDWWRWLIDHYLFVRIPLVRPANFLRKTSRFVEPFYTRTSLIIFASIGLLGLFLVSRQWEHFLAPFAYMFSLEGLLAYGVALGAVKILHEMGHAYTATRYGCRVPTMGVSFLVMMPVLYTDTTSAWQLTSRKKRMAIDCAGVATELMIASVALLGWALLADGPVRSALHVLATTSLITTLFINASPFMRFDGYYMFSDALGVPNLQGRAFALGRWRLRQFLFDLREDPPEDVPLRLERTMIIYAYCTWWYRFFLFIGIALLVYYFFFKILGIILFIVELFVFIGRPIVAELKVWYGMRDRIASTSRSKKLAWLLGGAFVLMLLPLDRHISAPAVMTPIGNTPLVVGNPAQLQQIFVENGQHVEAGQLLFVLADPEVDRDITSSRATILRLETQVSRAGSDARDLANVTVLNRELLSERQRMEGLERRRTHMTIRAATAGRVVDVPQDLHTGRWVTADYVLGRVVTPGRYDIQAYLSESDVWRVKNDANARFVPDDVGQRSRRAKATELSRGALEYIDNPIVASTNGGPVAAVLDKNGQIKPEKATYRLRLVAERDADEANADVMQVPGRVIVNAAGDSVLSRFARLVSQIFKRESSLTS